MVIGGNIFSVLCLLGLSLIFIPNLSASDVAIDVEKNSNLEFLFLKMENNKKNMIYSPLSIEYALDMLQEGALNNTYDEINKVIGNRKLPKYTNIDKVLSLANGLFIKDEFYKYIKPEYINTLKEKYDAEVKQDEFKNSQNANQWIENKTLGVINNVVNDEAVQDPDLIMLIINALAIDMDWAYKFDDKDTDGDPFYLDNGEKIIATMMSRKKIKSDEVSYHIDGNITVLSMDLKDYNETQLEFLAIMPKENLSGYIENITKEEINEIDKNLYSSKGTLDGVNVIIPKFQFSYNLELKKNLKKLGIEDVFDKEHANLSNIADENEMERTLFVSDVLHKADIEFTEKGIKAAAVSVVIYAGSAAAGKEFPINIIINQPFMFIIRDKSTKDIWFTGTVYEPNLWANDKESYSKKKVIDITKKPHPVNVTP